MKKQITSLIPTELRNSLRLNLYRSEVFFQRVKFANIKEPRQGWPILVANSFPKSGSHLLDQVLMGFSKISPFSPHVSLPFVSFDGETGLKKEASEAMRFLSQLRPLDVTSTHLLAWPQVMEELRSPRYLPYFIYRDPRDVVVSHVFYITEMEPTHAHYNYYNQTLKNFDERLMVSILGRPDADHEFLDIGKRFDYYRGWMYETNVLCLKYEDFIHDRMNTLARVADHFLARVETITLTSSQIAETLEVSINPKRSPTFRSGRTGEWKKYFKDSHKRAFKDVAGDLLIKLGYEKNNDW